VRAKDGPANDPSTLVRTWKVDTVAPTAAFVVGRGPNEHALQSSATETFALSSDDPEATFSCRLDAAPFAPCSATPTVTGLRNGPHTFEARATDAAGNTSASTTRSWTVAGLPVAAPVVALKATPGKKSTKVKQLVLNGLLAGDTVALSCAGKGCPKPTTLTATGPSLDLSRWVRKPLRPGTTLTIRVDDAGVVTTITVKVRRGKKPRASVG
jgi:hypothetical protein